MSTALAFEPQPVPLACDTAGRLMVVGTRVPLEALMAAFKRGESPEAIHESYDTVSLADIFAVLAYYLNHRTEVESYLSERERHDAATREWIETEYPTDGLRARLLARPGE